jgi:ribokinase
MHVATLPKAGETILGDAFSEPLDGGKATNQAVAAARLGAPVALITTLGSDERGIHARQLLEDEGIDRRFAFTVAGSTDVGFVLVLPDGVPAIVSNTACSSRLDAQLVESARPVLIDASIVVCQLEAPQAAALTAFRIARASGSLNVLNVAPIRSLEPELLALTDVLVANEVEARALGVDIEQDQRAGRLAELLGVSTVIVTVGPAGAWLGRPGQPDSHIVAPVVAATDTTGAGDAFVGALAAELLRGACLDAATAFAVEVASASVTRAGSIPSYPHRSQLAVEMSCDPGSARR